MNQIKFIILCLVLTLISCNTMQIDERFLPEKCFEGNFLPIGKAIYDNNHEEMVKQLKYHQVSIDSVGKGGKTGKPTFAMYAVFLENAAMVNAILEMGADPNKVSLITPQKNKIDLETGEKIYYYFQNPLNYASGYIKDISKAKEISGLLIDNGADVNGWGDYYNAPLENAVVLHSGNEASKMVDFFLSKGADINGHLNKSSGSTLLMSIEGEWSMVDHLLNKGADPKTLDFTGWDFMWHVDSRLKRGGVESNPSLEALKNKLINQYGMNYPPIQNKEKGDSIRHAEYKKKGWTLGVNGKFIIPEEIAYYDELRGK